MTHIKMHCLYVWRVQYLRSRPEPFDNLVVFLIDFYKKKKLILYYKSADYKKQYEHLLFPFIIENIPPSDFYIDDLK